MQINSISGNYAPKSIVWPGPCALTFGWADPSGGVLKASNGISAGGPEREIDTKDSFSRLDTPQQPVKKGGIKNIIKRIFKK